MFSNNLILQEDKAESSDEGVDSAAEESGKELDSEDQEEESDSEDEISDDEENDCELQQFFWQQLGAICKFRQI